MSLWHKQPESIIYSDLDAFCAQQIPEGIRLDYKLEVPNDLAKVVAAFANTLGGLIILGVDADKVTNTPNWPPTKGMKKEKGLDERITAICRDSIFPRSIRKSAPSSTTRTSLERPWRFSAWTKARKLLMR